MKRIVSLSVSLMAALTLLVGCGSGDAGTETSNGTPSEQSVSSSVEKEELTQDETPLDVETASTPEGVVNAFFRAFFRGDSEGAFMLLSERAHALPPPGTDEFEASEAVKSFTLLRSISIVKTSP